MPIHPDNKHRYPPDWKEISLRIRERAKWRCECNGICGKNHWDNRCLRPDKRIVKRDYESGCVLTVAHLNHDPSDCRDENLLALCEGCHNRYDMEHRVQERKAR